jgi:hypothetical protein
VAWVSAPENSAALRSGKEGKASRSQKIAPCVLGFLSSSDWANVASLISRAQTLKSILRGILEVYRYYDPQ